MKYFLLNIYHQFFLVGFLNSPFSQDLSEPFEIIIADDASHDGAVSPFSRELEKSQCPARLIAREKNVAFKQNWSKGLRLAKSPIIEYVDVDQWLAINGQGSVVTDQLSVIHKAMLLR